MIGRQGEGRADLERRPAVGERSFLVPLPSRASTLSAGGPASSLPQRLLIRHSRHVREFRLVGERFLARPRPSERLRRLRGGGGAGGTAGPRQSGNGSRRERMAAVVAAPLAAGSEDSAPATSFPGTLGLPGSRSAERALEEAVATGTLNLSNRRLKHFPRGAARSYDLSDITQAGE